MSTLFINASPNKDGNTVRLAKRLLAGTPHKALDLVDCLLLPYGQHREGARASGSLPTTARHTTSPPSI